MDILALLALTLGPSGCFRTGSVTGLGQESGPGDLAGSSDAQRDSGGRPGQEGGPTADAGSCQADSDCLDDLACTEDRCLEQGCTHQPMAGFCLIAGQCHAAGALNPVNACSSCDPAADSAGWTLTPSCVTTLAGNGQQGFADGPVAAAMFDEPMSVWEDSEGRVYVADKNNNRIRLINEGQVTTFAGDGSAASQDGPLLSASFNGPHFGIGTAQGDFYVADTGGCRIRKISEGQVTTIAGTGVCASVDGALSLAQLNTPVNLSLDDRGTIYFVEYQGNLLRKIEGGAVTTIAGSGLPSFSDGLAAQAAFNNPAGVVVDTGGRIFIGDAGNSLIRLFKDGMVSTYAGTGEPGLLDGLLADARFSSPRGVTLDPAGRLWVAETQNHSLRLIAHGQVTTVAGTGLAGFADGPAALSEFRAPRHVAPARSGAVYVADRYNHRIRIVSP